MEDGRSSIINRISDSGLEHIRFTIFDLRSLVGKAQAQSAVQVVYKQLAITGNIAAQFTVRFKHNRRFCPTTRRNGVKMQSVLPESHSKVGSIEITHH